MGADFGEDGGYVEISVPTQLVGRVVNAIVDVMVQWEQEQSEAGEGFNALTGNAAMHIAVDYLDAIVEAAAKGTIQ